MKAAKILEQMEMEEFRRKYPSNPYPFVKKRKTSKANGLTQAIVKFLQLSGWQAERISVTGRMIDERKIVTDVIGHQRQIGSVKWIPPSMTKGSADISATIAGRSVKIEVKIGSDRQRPEQVRYQEQVERAGGVYVIARDLDSFVSWYNEFIRP